MTRPRLRPVHWLIASLICILLVSVMRGPDANWDLRNYHYYNGRAIATLSFLEDVAPAGIQTYSNPLVDIPIYVFVELAGWRWGLVLWTAALQWLCYVSVWRLTGLFASLRETHAIRLLAFILAVTGAGAASVAFTTFGDWVVAALLCEAIIQSVRWIRTPAEGMCSRLVLGGFLFGLAMGVKMTAATFVIAATVALVVIEGVRVWRFVVGAIGGFLALHGAWMLFLLVRFGNPLFPYYNRIFRSPSAPESNFDDRRYGATSIADVVQFPLRAAEGGIQFTELYLQEWRFLGLLVACVLAVIVLRPRQALLASRHKDVRFLLIFLVLSFLLWVVTFGIYRYFLLGEIFAALLVAAIVSTLIHSRAGAAAVLALIVVVGFRFQALPDWGRGDILRNDELTTIVESRRSTLSHVIFVGTPPFGYLADAFPSGTRFASMFAYDQGELTLDGPLKTQLEEFVAAGIHEGGLTIVHDAGNPTLPPALTGLSIDACEPFESLGRAMELCGLTGPSG